jgi:signal peptidase II
MRKAWYLLVGLLILVADQATKAAVLKAFPLGGGKALTPWFSIIHWQNQGGLFGLMDGLPPPARIAVFMLLPVLGVGFLAVLFVKSKRWWELLILSAVLGGAAGNLVDRARFGAVVDFLDFHWPGGPAWPSFNVADAFLSTGIFVYLLLTLARPHTEEKRAPGSVQDR